MSFTFVNTIGAPGLNKGAAKKVRGHVTRTNFAARRVQKAKATNETLGDTAPLRGEQSPEVLATLGLRPLSELEIAVALSLATSRTDPKRAAILLNELWPIIFLHSGKEDSSTAAWRDLLTSEPALVEATMAVTMRCWQRSDECLKRSDIHSSKAIRMAIERISSGHTYTDGFLAVAITLAFGEYVLQNKSGQEVHVNAVAQAVKERRSRGMEPMPPVIMDILIHDSVNAMFGSQRFFSQSVIEQIAGSTSSISSIAVRVATTATRLSQVRQIINREQQNWANSSDAPRHTQEDWMKCCIEARTYQDNPNPFVRVASRVFEIVLFFSTKKKEDGIMVQVADKLKGEMEGLPGRSCMYMDLTSCPLILGAIAAREGSETKRWFVGRLRKAVQAIRLRGWKDPFGFLRRAVEADELVLRCLDRLKEEICGEESGVEES